MLKSSPLESDSLNAAQEPDGLFGVWKRDREVGKEKFLNHDKVLRSVCASNSSIIFVAQPHVKIQLPRKITSP